MLDSIFNRKLQRTSRSKGNNDQNPWRHFTAGGIIFFIIGIILGRCSVQPVEVQVPLVVPITVIATNTPEPTATATATYTATPRPTRTPTQTHTASPTATSVVTSDTFTIIISDSENSDDLIVTLGDDETDLPLDEPVVVYNNSRYWIRFDRYTWLEGESPSADLARYDIAPGTSMVIPPRGNHAAYMPDLIQPTHIPEQRG